MSAPVFGGVDSLVLGDDWEVQSVSGGIAANHVEAPGANGDVIAETTHNPLDSGTCQAIYIGEETAFAAAFANFWPGKLVATDTILISGLGIDYAPCASGKRPLVTFTWRGSPPAAPTTPYWYTTDLVLPTYVAAALVVPDILTVTAGSAECQSAQWGLSIQVGDDTGASGAWLAAAGYKGQETINLSYVGIPTSITSTGWMNPQLVSALGPNTSNSAYDVHPYTFVRKVARVTS